MKEEFFRKTRLRKDFKKGETGLAKFNIFYMMLQKSVPLFTYSHYLLYIFNKRIDLV